ncbi:MAG: hypothetical protein ACT4QG_12420 [Sporichthyaceae bacterium]
MQDNASMTWYRQNLTTKMFGAVAEALADAVDPLPKIAVLNESASPTSITDVIYHDGNYETLCGRDWHPDDLLDLDFGFTVAIANCQTLSGSKCDQSEVRFDDSYFQQSSVSIGEAEGYSCHETGHTLGLLHRNTDGGCMTDPPPQSPSLFSQHDIAHINANY